MILITCIQRNVSNINKCKHFFLPSTRDFWYVLILSGAFGLLQCWDYKHPTERKIPLLRGRTKPFRQFSVLKKWSHKEMLSKHLISQNSRYKRARSVKKATHFLSSQRLHSQNTKKVDKTKKKCLTSIIAVSWKTLSTKTERSFKRSSLHFCQS